MLPGMKNESKLGFDEVSQEDALAMPSRVQEIEG